MATSFSPQKMSFATKRSIVAEGTTWTDELLFLLWRLPRNTQPQRCGKLDLKYGYSRFSHKEMSKSAHILLMTDLCILVFVFFTTKYGCNQSSDVWYIGFVLFFFKLTDGVVFTYHSSDSELNPDVIFKISPWVDLHKEGPKYGNNGISVKQNGVQIIGCRYYLYVGTLNLGWQQRQHM